MIASPGGAAAHCVDVAQGGGRGDLTERERIVDNGRNEIGRLNDREIVPEQVDGRIILAVESDKKTRIVSLLQRAHDLMQVERAHFRRASATRYAGR